MKREQMLIEAGELIEKLGDRNLRIFDATVSDGPYRQGHIPGAAYFDHERFSDPASPYECTILSIEALVEKIGLAGISNDNEVVVYSCGMFPYAARAWWVLHYAGHEHVRILNGGLEAWQHAGGSIEQEARQYPPTTFQGNPRPELFAGKAEVMAAMGKKGISIVDVLPAQSYEAAHITGSVNLSCMDLMSGLNSLLPTEAIAPRLAGFSQYKRVITYCGGGIAAAVNAMAHLLVGQENVAVYDGSLYEWVAEELPMTGDGDWVIWK